MSSSTLDGIVTVAAVVIALAGVAALGQRALDILLSNPIPYRDKVRLYGLYGTWAVNMAEALCPTGDVACVEREAQRYYQVRQARGL